MCLLYKILNNAHHLLHCKLPQYAKLTRITRHTAQQNDKAFVMARYSTYQFSWRFTYFTTRLWSSIPNEVGYTKKNFDP